MLVSTLTGVTSKMIAPLVLHAEEDFVHRGIFTGETLIDAIDYVTHGNAQFVARQRAVSASMTHISWAQSKRHRAVV